MNRDLKERNRVLVGLMMTFALLFFCTFVAWDEKDNSDFLKKYIVKPEKKVAKIQQIEELEGTDDVMDTVDAPMIALTFDDGPSIYTDELLAVLESYDVKATFFVLGSRVEQYPSTMKKMEELDCEIASHTYHHYDLTKLTPEQIQVEVGGTNWALNNVLGHGAESVRPPYGATTEETRNTIGYPLVMWSVDTTDWQSKDANAVANHVLEVVKDGDIVLMHDIYQSTVEAVKIMIPVLQERGYQIVTVKEMAESRGVSLESGKLYYNFYK